MKVAIVEGEGVGRGEASVFSGEDSGEEFGEFTDRDGA